VDIIKPNRHIPYLTARLIDNVHVFFYKHAVPNGTKKITNYELKYNSDVGTNWANTQVFPYKTLIRLMVSSFY
ncbi:MAG: hypothetical protein LBI60_05255, partial [Bacteroidales bacterium]|nr:hypothetical protein [Bacteroidales bacterium]